jgi:hypothetical protein
MSPFFIFSFDRHDLYRCWFPNSFPPSFPTCARRDETFHSEPLDILPIFMAKREEFACIRCNRSHAKVCMVLFLSFASDSQPIRQCSKDFDEYGQPEDCQPCTDRGIVCEYRPGQRASFGKQAPPPQPTCNPRVQNAKLQGGAVFGGGGSGDHHGGFLPQYPTTVADIDYALTDRIGGAIQNATYGYNFTPFKLTH